MQFPVTITGEARLVECRFATEVDVLAVGDWSSLPREDDANPVKDAAEYAGLAAQKWLFYREVDRIASSLEELRQTIKKNSAGEVASMLVVLAAWHHPKPQIGFCFFRRSWSHNLLIDFLANSPTIMKDTTKIRGIATGLMYSVMAVGEALDAGCCLGEATDESAGF